MQSCKRGMGQVHTRLGGTLGIGPIGMRPLLEWDSALQTPCVTTAHLEIGLKGLAH